MLFNNGISWHSPTKTTAHRSIMVHYSFVRIHSSIHDNHVPRCSGSLVLLSLKMVWIEENSYSLYAVLVHQAKNWLDEGKSWRGNPIGRHRPYAVSYISFAALISSPTVGSGTRVIRTASGKGEPTFIFSSIHVPALNRSSVSCFDLTRHEFNIHQHDQW